METRSSARRRPLESWPGEVTAVSREAFIWMDCTSPGTPHWLAASEGAEEMPRPSTRTSLATNLGTDETEGRTERISNRRPVGTHGQGQSTGPPESATVSTEATRPPTEVMALEGQCEEATAGTPPPSPERGDQEEISLSSTSLQELAGAVGKPEHSLGTEVKAPSAEGEAGPERLEEMADRVATTAATTPRTGFEPDTEVPGDGGRPGGVVADAATGTEEPVVPQPPSAAMVAMEATHRVVEDARDPGVQQVVRKRSEVREGAENQGPAEKVARRRHTLAREVMEATAPGAGVRGVTSRLLRRSAGTAVTASTGVPGAPRPAFRATKAPTDTFSLEETKRKRPRRPKRSGWSRPS